MSVDYSSHSIQIGEYNYSDNYNSFVSGGAVSFTNPQVSDAYNIMSTIDINIPDTIYATAGSYLVKVTELVNSYSYASVTASIFDIPIATNTYSTGSVVTVSYNNDPQIIHSKLDGSYLPDDIIEGDQIYGNIIGSSVLAPSPINEYKIYIQVSNITNARLPTTLTYDNLIRVNSINGNIITNLTQDHLKNGSITTNKFNAGELADSEYPKYLQITSATEMEWKELPKAAGYYYNNSGNIEYSYGEFSLIFSKSIYNGLGSNVTIEPLLRSEYILSNRGMIYSEDLSKVAYIGGIGGIWHVQPYANSIYIMGSFLNTYTSSGWKYELQGLYSDNLEVVTNNIVNYNISSTAYSYTATYNTHFKSALDGRVRLNIIADHYGTGNGDILYLRNYDPDANTFYVTQTIDSYAVGTHPAALRADISEDGLLLVVFANQQYSSFGGAGLLHEFTRSSIHEQFVKISSHTIDRTNISSLSSVTKTSVVGIALNPITKNELFIVDQGRLEIYNRNLSTGLWEFKKYILNIFPQGSASILRAFLNYNTNRLYVCVAIASGTTVYCLSRDVYFNSAGTVGAGLLASIDDNTVDDTREYLDSSIKVKGNVYTREGIHRPSRISTFSPITEFSTISLSSIDNQTTPQWSSSHETFASGFCSGRFIYLSPLYSTGILKASVSPFILRSDNPDNVYKIDITNKYNTLLPNGNFASACFDGRYGFFLPFLDNDKLLTIDTANADELHLHSIHKGAAGGVIVQDKLVLSPNKSSAAINEVNNYTPMNSDMDIIKSSYSSSSSSPYDNYTDLGVLSRDSDGNSGVQRHKILKSATEGDNRYIVITANVNNSNELAVFAEILNINTGSTFTRSTIVANPLRKPLVPTIPASSSTEAVQFIILNSVSTFDSTSTDIYGIVEVKSYNLSSLNTYQTTTVIDSSLTVVGFKITGSSVAIGTPINLGTPAGLLYPARFVTNYDYTAIPGNKHIASPILTELNEHKAIAHNNYYSGASVSNLYGVLHTVELDPITLDITADHLYTSSAVTFNSDAHIRYIMSYILHPDFIIIFSNYVSVTNVKNIGYAIIKLSNKEVTTLSTFDVSTVYGDTSNSLLASNIMFSLANNVAIIPDSYYLGQTEDGYFTVNIGYNLLAAAKINNSIEGTDTADAVKSKLTVRVNAYIKTDNDIYSTIFYDQDSYTRLVPPYTSSLGINKNFFVHKLIYAVQKNYVYAGRLAVTPIFDQDSEISKVAQYSGTIVLENKETVFNDRYSTINDTKHMFRLSDGSVILLSASLLNDNKIGRLRIDNDKTKIQLKSMLGKTSNNNSTIRVYNIPTEITSDNSITLDKNISITSSSNFIGAAYLDTNRFALLGGSELMSGAYNFSEEPLPTSTSYVRDDDCFMWHNEYNKYNLCVLGTDIYYYNSSTDSIERHNMLNMSSTQTRLTTEGINAVARNMTKFFVLNNRTTAVMGGFINSDQLSDDTENIVTSGIFSCDIPQGNVELIIVPYLGSINIQPMEYTLSDIININQQNLYDCLKEIYIYSNILDGVMIDEGPPASCNNIFIVSDTQIILAKNVRIKPDKLTLFNSIGLLGANVSVTVDDTVTLVFKLDILTDGNITVVDIRAFKQLPGTVLQNVVFVNSNLDFIITRKLYSLDTGKNPCILTYISYNSPTYIVKDISEILQIDPHLNLIKGKDPAYKYTYYDLINSTNSIDINKVIYPRIPIITTSWEDSNPNKDITNISVEGYPKLVNISTGMFSISGSTYIYRDIRTNFWSNMFNDTGNTTMLTYTNNIENCRFLGYDIISTNVLLKSVNTSNHRIATSNYLYSNNLNHLVDMYPELMHYTTDNRSGSDFRFSGSFGITNNTIGYPTLVISSTENIILEVSLSISALLGLKLGSVVYDGKFLYGIPVYGSPVSKIIRVDIRGILDNNNIESNVVHLDLPTTEGSLMWAGGVLSGRYLYLVPMSNANAIRIDITTFDKVETLLLDNDGVNYIGGVCVNDYVVYFPSSRGDGVVSNLNFALLPTN
jgi:hypothetical protein